MLPSPLRTSTCHTKNQKGAIKPVLFHWKAVLLQHSSSTCWRHAAQPSQQPTHASQAARHSPSSHTCCGHSRHCSNSNTNAVWSKKTSAACCLPRAPTKCHVHCPSHPGSCSSAALTQPCIPHIGEHAKHKQFWQASPTLHAATPPPCMQPRPQPRAATPHDIASRRHQHSRVGQRVTQRTNKKLHGCHRARQPAMQSHKGCKRKAAIVPA